MSLDKDELDRVYSLLGTVKDPEIGASIIKLGMVAGVAESNGSLLVKIKLTVPGCPLSSTIEKDIKDALKDCGYSQITVEFSYMTKEELENVKKEVYTNNQKLPSQIEKYDKKSIKRIIAVYSAKGGVGKSTVVALMAMAASKAGYKTAILDCDVSGPSIQTIFGASYRSSLTKDKKFVPLEVNGVKIISIDMLTDTQALIWRGPLVSSAIKQMYSETGWGDLDVLFLDLPPGTSDGPITVFQSIPVDSIVLVTTPQNLSQVVGKKTMTLADALKVPVAGLIENMSYIKCDHCGERIDLPMENKLENIEILAKLPYKKELSASLELGTTGELTKELSSAIEKILPKQ